MGKHVEPGIEEVGKVKLIGQGLDSRFCIGDIEHSCIEAEVFGGGEPTVEEGLVEDDANGGPDCCVVPGNIVTVDEKVTGSGFDEGGEELD